MKALELKVPPVVVGLIIGALMWATAAKLPIAPVAITGAPIVAAIFAIAGIAVAVSGVLSFRRMQTTVHPGTPEKASAVVSAGIYRFSRNPMYLGLALLLAGWGVFIGDAGNAILLLAFIAYRRLYRIQVSRAPMAVIFAIAALTAQLVAFVVLWYLVSDLVTLPSVLFTAGDYTIGELLPHVIETMISYWAAFVVGAAGAMTAVLLMLRLRFRPVWFLYTCRVFGWIWMPLIPVGTAIGLATLVACRRAARGEKA